MNHFRRIGIAVLACAAVCMFAGCSGKNDEAREAYRQYGINCMQEGKYEDAANAFQKALDQSVGGISEVELDICYYKAQALYQSGDAEGALEVYTSIIDYKEDPRAYFLRGSLYYSTGLEPKEGQGEKDFDKAVSLHPENYELYIGIYEILSGQGDPLGNAADYLDKALKIPGDEADDHLQKGRIYYLLGDYDKAKELQEKAQSEGQKGAGYYLAQTYEALGDADAADSAFSTYLDSGLADADDLYHIGESMMKAGEYKRAIDCFDKALEMEDVPNEQIILKGRIAAYEFMGDFDKAKELLETYQKEYQNDFSMDEEKIFLETR